MLFLTAEAVELSSYLIPFLFSFLVLAYQLSPSGHSFLLFIHYNLHSPHPYSPTKYPPTSRFIALHKGSSPHRCYPPPPPSLPFQDRWDQNTKMCDYFRNYYIYSTCQHPAAHFLRTSLDGSKDTRCSEGPHDRFIVVVGKCLLCAR